MSQISQGGDRGFESPMRYQCFEHKIGPQEITPGGFAAIREFLEF